jgi:exosortase D (VPLPA-CTERM-specific)
LILFAEPARLLLRDWWSDPEAGHGLLLGPLAFVLAWRRGVLGKGHREAGNGPHPAVSPWPRFGWGVALLLGSVMLRYASGLAAELFTMRLSMLGAAAGLIVLHWGWAQLRHWWLPGALLVLSVPIPEVILNTLAFPLQLRASQIGAALLGLRHVPVILAGNVIHLPGKSLFVTEACSGLRSLTALIALGVLIGGLWLRRPFYRAALVVLALPLAVLLNGVRVFLTGFLVYYVSPAMGEGFMHLTEGWVVFVVAFGLLGGIAWILRVAERRTATAGDTPQQDSDVAIASVGASAGPPVRQGSVRRPAAASVRRWAPGVVLGVGALITTGVGAQRSMPLTMPLAEALPLRIDSFVGREVELGEAERRAVGAHDYLLRSYASSVHPDSEAFSVYVGYYQRQTRGETIHSPKNCMPGSGWEALSSQPATIETPVGAVTVNQYTLQKGQQQALVLYWYQGRGRVAWNEYGVKWDLLRDSALRRRSEEALVRVVVPVKDELDGALALGTRVAAQLVPDVYRGLPR